MRLHLHRPCRLALGAAPHTGAAAVCDAPGRGPDPPSDGAARREAQAGDAGTATEGMEDHAMTDAKHTPELLVVGYGGGITGPTTPSTSGAVCGGRDWPVTLVTSGTETIGIFPDQDNGKGSPLIGTGEAAATLFAAAPEMYEALLTAKDYLDDLQKGYLWGGDANRLTRIRHDQIDEDLARINSTLTKAKGEAT